MLLKRLHRLRNSDPDESGTDVLDQVEPEEILEEEQESEDSSVEAEEKEPETEESEELVVSIEGEQQDEEEAKAPNWVKELRRKNREDQKRIRELEEQLSKGSAPAKQEELGKEPELEDFDYDADQFKSAYKEWTAKKLRVEQQKEAARKQQEEVAKEWQSLVETYNKGKSRFPEAKMKEAEDEVVSVLPSARQSLLMEVADDSAQLVIALGSSPDTLRKLASIKSDAKFVKELTKIEGKITVKPATKTAPPPERTLSGNGKTPGASASRLESLKAEAEKTGDYSKYFAEKRRMSK